ncbi:MAG: twin-arginine translocase subunit TatC [Chloroflexi bacterium]|nr:twin-arginine translocase subunit TatC [Chloroflexota bacterium]MBT3669387.1 twin-arginine translocase subunit TatC [Chloroflexota bacterium]MBT4304594.1 twin-arginine translocase subunit TatC [Chloroflexota bacterium]MBT4534065.1 twin-arginine translocase subunit TatC [Chloroflexota bacterium]MBT4683284.1 twin-arginine translocase subunit TatC [Chloroflexota bacterium]
MGKIFSSIWQFLTAPFRWALKGLKTIFQKTPLAIFFEADPDDDSIIDTFQKTVDDPKGVLSAMMFHLNDLRKHIFNAILVLIVAVIVAFIFVPNILDFLSEPIGGIEEMSAIDITEPVSIVMRTAFMTGFVIALPYITFEILRFIAPGISRRARLIGLAGIPFITLFFLGGMAFTFYIILPAAIPALVNFMGIPTLVRPSNYLGFTLSLMFWIGLFFEFPIVSLIVSAMGSLTAKGLAKQWRIAVVIMTILAAIVTPTVDPINMMIVLLPLIGLYILSIAFAFIGQNFKFIKNN